MKSSNHLFCRGSHGTFPVPWVFCPDASQPHGTKCMPWLRTRILLFLLLTVFTIGSALAANIGTAVPVVGQVADLTYDEQRGLVYLANITENRVDVYSVASGMLLTPISAGLTPASLAISPDGQTLYVANASIAQPWSITAVDLNTQQPVNTISLTSRPDAVAVGNDGAVVVLTPAGLFRIDPATSQPFQLPISVPPSPPGIANIPGSAVPSGFRAGMVTSAAGNLIVGLSQLNAANGRLFVYDVASATVVRARNVTGVSAILSISGDGSRFMAGPFLFDTQTMSILGRAGTPSLNPVLTGGSAFSVDGNTVYGTFSNQTPINALNTNNPQNPGGAVLPGIGGRVPGAPSLGVLQVMRATSLTPLLGLRLTEAIHPKIIASSDGQNLFAISTSGLMVIPIGRLNQMPVLGVDTPNVVLSVNICNRALVTAQVQVQNLGSGRLTFTAALNNAGANVPVIVSQSTGLAPSTLRITFNPRTVTTRGTQQFAVVLLSPEAVNIEPAILVNINFRDTDQVGTIVPINGVGVATQLDEPRQRVYIANYTLDQIEVFSIPDQTFLPPIRVGNRPLSMAMVNPSTLVVANSGSELISVIDLDQMQVVDTIPMAPVPINATPLFPRQIAASNNAILFTAVPLPGVAGAAPGNGSLWQVSLATHGAFPRLNLGQNVNNVVQGRNRLLAPANGGAIVIYDSNGNIGNLRLYDPVADAFVASRPGAITGFRGTVSAAPDGSFFVIDDTIINSALGPVGTMTPLPPTVGGGGGGAAAQTTLTFGASAAGRSAVRVQPADAQVPIQRLQMINLANLALMREFKLPEQVMDISPTTQTSIAAVTRLWPPNVVGREIGVNGQTQLLPRAISVDSANNAYLLTLSGLSVVPLVTSAPRVPAFRSALNAASYTPQLAPGSLISIFGSNLAGSDSATDIPLPTAMGGVCVTANEVAIPLLYTSNGQINAQIPTELNAGRVTLTVRSTDLGLVSQGVPVQLVTAAPGVFSTEANGEKRALLYHSKDFSLVTPDHPAHRDEVLILYATGLGAVRPSVPSGQPGGSNPLSATTQNVAVRIGFSNYDVLYAGLAPGFVGTYQINIYVPGDRQQGDDLPVIVSVGTASSDTASPPIAAIH